MAFPYGTRFNMLYKVLALKFSPASRRGEAFVHFVSHGKHIRDKLEVLEHTVKVEKTEMLPGQIVSIEDITPQ